EVILVIFLGDPEWPSGRDFGDDGAAIDMRRVQIGDEVLGNLFLLLVEVENGRPIRRPKIVALAVAGSGVVDLEKEFKQFTVGQLFGVEDDLDAFGMCAVIAICGIGHVAARITDGRRDDAGKLADQLFDAPKTSACQDCFLCGHIVHFKCLCTYMIQLKAAECSAEEWVWRREGFGLVERFGVGRVVSLAEGLAARGWGWGMKISGVRGSDVMNNKNKEREDAR